MSSDALWLAVGLLAQLMFFLRFLIQWIVSERKKESTIPQSFWYLSVAGAIGLLTYAIHRKDPVFIIGPSAGLLIYLRNIYLLKRSKNQ